MWREIRTLVPDPQTHLVLAVCDGTFSEDPVRLSAHLRDGRTAIVA
jgi:hypothetical protein